MQLFTSFPQAFDILDFSNSGSNKDMEFQYIHIFSQCVIVDAKNILIHI